MPTARGARASRTRGRGRGSGRGAPSGGRGRPHAPNSRSRGSAEHAGVRKSRAPTTKRPVQPTVAAAILSYSTEEEPQTHEPAPAPAEPSKVNRIQRSDFMCTPDSLFFIKLGQLYTTPDTETITLNLMDHFLHVTPFPPELWHGLLHAACFLFASRLTGLENEAEWIAQTVELQAAGLAMMGVPGLAVDPTAVEKGFQLIVERRSEFVDAAGGYGDALERLAAPA